MHYLYGFGVPAIVLGVVVAVFGHSERLLHPSTWVFYVSAVTLQVLQPKVAYKKTADTASDDRGSAFGILAGTSLGMAGGLVDFFSRPELAPQPLSLWTLGGTLLIATATALRLWSIRTLGRWFTGLVQVVPGQQVVDTGPYRHVRHPSYTAIITSFFGSALLFRSVWGAALTVGLVLPVYLYRIRVEERLLLERLGDAYRKYQARTGALLPRLGR